jgi:hypothetical protein
VIERKRDGGAVRGEGDVQTLFNGQINFFVFRSPLRMTFRIKVKGLAEQYNKFRKVILKKKSI